MAEGAVLITVFNPSPGGGTSEALSFERIHYAPTISSLSPATVSQGGPGFTLTVGGANYLSGGSTVQWNGAGLPTDFVSASQLKVNIPAARITSSPDVVVTVETRAGGSSKTSAAKTLVISRLGKESLTERGQFDSLFKTLDCRSRGDSYVMVGVRGKSGWAIDELRVGCRKMLAGGTLDGTTEWPCAGIRRTTAEPLSSTRSAMTGTQSAARR